MLKSLKFKGAALAVSVALLGGTAWLAAGATGAYFSDTHPGTITGTIGAIRVTPYDGNNGGMNLKFTNLLPGVSQTATVKYQNTGTDPEDVYIVFNNTTALNALNDLGSYGEVHLSAGQTPLFDSVNLDNHANCEGDYSPAPGKCWPLAAQYKVASNVLPGVAGTISFSFNYASKMLSATSADWNPYPIASQTNYDPTVTGGTGLPYEIVATQVGITPGH